MMRWLVGNSLKIRFLVIASAAGLMYFGMGQLRKMPVDVFPEFAPPLVEIQTVCLGLSAAEVEALVTVPLEQALNGVPGLDIMRSKSVEQLSSVKMIFKPDTDLFRARQVVHERLLVMPTLPTWAAPPVVLPPLSALSRVMKIGVSSKSVSLIDLSMISYWTIRERLLRVPGVANVAIWGERLKMPQVQVVPELLKKHGVTLEEVMTATSDSLDVGMFMFSDGHYIGAGGWIDTPNQRLQVRHVLPLIYKTDELTTPDALGNMPVAVRNGKQLYLKDVAEIVVDHQPMAGDAIINDGPGLLLIVEKFPWGNTLQVTKGVEEALDALRPGLSNIDIDSTIFRPATFIEMSIDNLTRALLLGCLLVVLILASFLFDWRPALISCLAIPLSLMGAVIVLYLRGATINTMVLAGLVIAVGVVVDDAIIDIENIIRRLRQHRKEASKKSTARIILEASLEVRGAIIYATLIDAMTLLPVFFLTGLSGAFFRPLAISYALAVLASLLVALTVTPAMALILLRNAPLEHRGSPLVPWLQRKYETTLARIIRRPRAAYVTVAVTVLAGVVTWPLLGHSLLPSFKERDFLMHWLTKPGTSWPEMNRITIQASKELRSIPGVRNLGAHIGQALIMDEVVGINFGENWVSVDPSVDYDKTVAALQATVNGYPGLFRDVLTFLKERIREVLTGASQAIVVRIYGQDLDVLHSKGNDVKEALKGIDGIVDLHVELHENIPQIEVKLDLAKAQRYGLKPGDVRRAAAVLVAGEEAGDIHTPNKTYDVQVWSIPAARNTLTDIRKLLIDTPGGGHVQLQDVADVRITPTPNVIQHENLKRRLDVRANVRGRDLGSVVADVEARLQKVKFPREYYPELVGEYKERQAAQRSILIFSAVAAAGVFMFLFTSFQSGRLATLSFLTLPMALVGGVLGAYLGDGIISLGSLVGFLTVWGIAARNGIMMINHFQHLERYEGEAFGPALVLRGARERLSPILMTTLATALALVPLVIAGNLPGHEIEHPLAVVVLGGLVTSTLLNLFVVPSLYLRFGSSRKPDTSRPQLA
ncbi:MAG: efflux RND transporter permease subunit [candidate division NC10 bacterium]|nr:efflux RND transporter permease subunit [candidate division NC10 bacterium]